MRIYLALSLAILLSACTDIIRTTDGSDQVRLYFMKNKADTAAILELERGCTLIGEVIGSEGHWYTSLFINNTDQVQGAINDLKNNAHSMGANTVAVYDNLAFSSSVTLLGQAYHCTNGKARKDSKSHF